MISFLLKMIVSLKKKWILSFQTRKIDRKEMNWIEILCKIFDSKEGKRDKNTRNQSLLWSDLLQNETEEKKSNRNLHLRIPNWVSFSKISMENKHEPNKN